MTDTNVTPRRRRRQGFIITDILPKEKNNQLAVVLTIIEIIGAVLALIVTHSLGLW